MPQVETRMLTVPEAAARLGVTDRQVRNMIKAGTLAASKFGRDWQITSAAVAAVPRDRKPGPKPKPKRTDR